MIDYRGAFDRLVHTALVSLGALTIDGGWDDVAEKITTPSFVIPVVLLSFGISVVASHPSTPGDSTASIGVSSAPDHLLR